MRKNNRTQVYNYILQHMQETVRVCEHDTVRKIGLPKPYNVPSISEGFQDMYYWDTYFLSVGLIASGDLEQAKNNCENMFYLVDRFGYVPNANRKDFLGGSQPPYLSFFIAELYAAEGDKTFLRRAYPALLKEYFFWQTERMTPVGLNRYYTHRTEEAVLEGVAYYADRLHLTVSPEDALEFGRNSYAEGESGWDMSPRFQGRCTQFLPVDLNSNLYAYERSFARFERELGISDGALWEERAARRKKRMDACLLDHADGIYKDYDFVNGERSSVISCAAFHPYFAGLADRESGADLKVVYRALMQEYGLAVTDRDHGVYQWAYPNGWAPLQYVGYRAMKAYGFSAEAEEIRKKYLRLVERVFEETGGLWEKYNVVRGNTDAVNEYEMPEMLGWTAGVYLYFSEQKGEE